MPHYDVKPSCHHMPTVSAQFCSAHFSVLQVCSRQHTYKSIEDATLNLSAESRTGNAQCNMVVAYCSMQRRFHVTEITPNVTLT